LKAIGQGSARNRPGLRQWTSMAMTKCGRRKRHEGICAPLQERGPCKLVVNTGDMSANADITISAASPTPAPFTREFCSLCTVVSALLVLAGVFFTFIGLVGLAVWLVVDSLFSLYYRALSNVGVTADLRPQRPWFELLAACYVRGCR